jgi:hypothetical protein
MHLVEHPGLGPALQSPPAGHPRAEPEFMGQVFPNYPGMQHEQGAVLAGLGNLSGVAFIDAGVAA